MVANTSLAERVAALEAKFDAYSKDQQEINAKLDDLLALRNKGIGAFWLATSLAGIGAISIFVQFLHWMGLK